MAVALAFVPSAALAQSGCGQYCPPPIDDPGNDPNNPGNPSSPSGPSGQGGPSAAPSGDGSGSGSASSGGGTAGDGGTGGAAPTDSSGAVAEPVAPVEDTSPSSNGDGDGRDRKRDDDDDIKRAQLEKLKLLADASARPPAALSAQAASDGIGALPLALIAFLVLVAGTALLLRRRSRGSRTGQAG